MIVLNTLMLFYFNFNKLFLANLRRNTLIKNKNKTIQDAFLKLKDFYFKIFKHNKYKIYLRKYWLVIIILD